MSTYFSTLSRTIAPLTALIFLSILLFKVVPFVEVKSVAYNLPFIFSITRCVLDTEPYLLSI